MFHCKFSTCGSVFDTMLKFVQHIKLHNNSTNQCGVPEYPRTYFKLTALKAHMYRDHKADWPLRNSQLPLCDTPIQCDFCAVRIFIFNLSFEVTLARRITSSMPN